MMGFEEAREHAIETYSPLTEAGHWDDEFRQVFAAGARWAAERAAAELRRAHWPVQHTGRTAECRDNHPQHNHEDVPYEETCLEEYETCNGCGTSTCRELPRLDPLFDDLRR